jgi:hypothetical protein
VINGKAQQLVQLLSIIVLRWLIPDQFTDYVCEELLVLLGKNEQFMFKVVLAHDLCSSGDTAIITRL